MFETVQLPICHECETTIDIWKDDLVTNAWQKPVRNKVYRTLDTFNFYEFVCPECGTKQACQIPVEGDPEVDYVGKVLLSAVKQWLSFPVH